MILAGAWACAGRAPESESSLPQGATPADTAPVLTDAPPDSMSATRPPHVDRPPDDEADPSADAASQDEAAPAATEVATLGAGCFWCIEAVLLQVEGVRAVRSGYMGGRVENPTYQEICTGRTGHAEVVEVTFDPAVLSYEHLLAWFWKLHDPTTLNRQGADVGTQYRSAIFVHSEEQRRVAEASKAAQDASGTFADPIVTEITDAESFWVAEDYHQDYYRQNKRQPYCRAVIAPKLDKLGLED